jgi:hypothetical protein
MIRTTVTPSLRMLTLMTRLAFGSFPQTQELRRAHVPPPTCHSGFTGGRPTTRCRP